MVSGGGRPGEGADQQGDHSVQTSHLHAAKVNVTCARMALSWPTGI